MAFVPLALTRRALASSRWTRTPTPEVRPRRDGASMAGRSFVMYAHPTGQPPVFKQRETLQRNGGGRRAMCSTTASWAVAQAATSRGRASRLHRPAAVARQRRIGDDEAHAAAGVERAERARAGSPRGRGAAPARAWRARRSRGTSPCRRCGLPVHCHLPSQSRALRHRPGSAIRPATKIAHRCRRSGRPRPRPRLAALARRRAPASRAPAASPRSR